MLTKEQVRELLEEAKRRSPRLAALRAAEFSSFLKEGRDPNRCLSVTWEEGFKTTLKEQGRLRSRKTK